jgi:tryptophan synthase alpha chain
VDVLARNGASAIEIQIPFSEPIADGPLFLAANQQALSNGVTVEQSVAFMADVAKAHPAVAFIAMTYANILYRGGVAHMAKRLADAGVRGVICPDWPIDSGDDLLGPLTQAGLYWVPLIAPTTTLQRAKFLLPHGDGFVYVVARAGVTGSRSEVSVQLTHRLNDLAKLTSLPLAVGFGIQSADDIVALRGQAQFAVVGSQSLRVFEREGISGLERLWQSFAHEAR